MVGQVQPHCLARQSARSRGVSKGQTAQTEFKPLPYKGQQFCGREEAFLFGGVHGIDTPLAVNADGSCDCCEVAQETWGGVVIGGSAAWMAFLGETWRNSSIPGSYAGTTTITVDNSTYATFSGLEDSGLVVETFGTGQVLLTMVLAYATASYPGILSTGTQTIAGPKTLTDPLVVAYGDSTATVPVLSLGDGYANCYYTTNYGGTLSLLSWNLGFTGTSVGVSVQLTNDGTSGLNTGITFTGPFDEGLNLYVSSSTGYQKGKTGTVLGLTFVSGWWTGGALSGVITGGSGGTTGLTLTTSTTTLVIGGILNVSSGGTGANLSTTGGTVGGAKEVVFQSTTGGAFTVGLLAASDIPDLPASKITSGQLALAQGGTAADLSGTGGTGYVVQQPTPGGPLVSELLGVSAIPDLPASKITSGQLALAQGGTAADLSATGGPNAVLSQPTPGGPIQVLDLSSLLDALGGITGTY